MGFEGGVSNFTKEKNKKFKIKRLFWSFSFFEDYFGDKNFKIAI